MLVFQQQFQLWNILVWISNSKTYVTYIYRTKTIDRQTDQIYIPTIIYHIIYALPDYIFIHIFNFICEYYLNVLRNSYNLKCGFVYVKQYSNLIYMSCGGLTPTMWVSCLDFVSTFIQWIYTWTINM